MTQRLASVSVDLDSLPHYLSIHGLGSGNDATLHTRIYDVAVPRLLELFDEVDVPATFFAIGSDLAWEPNVRALAQAHRSGVEIANHSHHHDYALSRLSPSAVFDEVWRAHQAIERAVGRAPVGFRAPGYTLSADVYASVRELGYTYDSSVFPAAPYYLAKAGVMASLALAGRPSRAILDSPAVLLAPTAPYHPDPAAPYRAGQGAVVELPITVSPVLRVPFIGTFAAAFPAPVVRAVYRSLRRVPHFNFELHAIDLMDASDGVPAALPSRQRDLRVPFSLKRTRLKEVLRWMVADFRMVTLRDAAAHFR